MSCENITSSIIRRFLIHRKHCVPSKTIRRMCISRRSADYHNAEDKPSHIPVMVNEVIEYLNVEKDNLVLDMTFGAGGHSTALLERNPDLQIIALDRDPLAQEFARKLGEKYPNRITSLVGKFSELPSLLKSHGIKQNSIDGILFDLGCSSMQFDYAERGFSISSNGPLDMRMDGQKLPNHLTAADVIAYANENELAEIIKTYGEERTSKKIARAIVEARFTFKPLTTTKDLCGLIESVCGEGSRHDKINRKTHIATKVFQALRIFVNNEINELNYGITLAQRYLKPKGRAVAISFHSLEDRVVKKHFKNHVFDDYIGSLPLSCVNVSKYYNFEEINFFQKKCWDIITKKVIVPTEQEVCENPRSRSAKLRAAVKI